MRTVMGLIHASLSDDLLSREWRGRKKASDHPTFGHCYLGAETLWYLWGKKRGFYPKVISGRGWTHWFLEHSDGRIADPTSGQWRRERIPYERGRRCAFLTQRLPRRCRRLLGRIRAFQSSCGLPTGV
jgi:hypothetical protein